MNNINIIDFTKAGLRHISIGESNQDSVRSYQDDKVAVAVLSDGASESEVGKEAAEITSDSGIEFAQNGSIWDMSKKELSDELLRVLDKNYLGAPFPYDRLTATMVMVAVNKVSNNFIAISIGDCSALMIDRKLNGSVFLSPVNLFFKKNVTVFANGSNASKFIKIESGNINGIAGFVLMTDGANDIMREDRLNDIRRLTALTVFSPDKAQTELEEYVTDQLSEGTNDDISLSIIMPADDEELTRISKAELGISDNCECFTEVSDEADVNYEDVVSAENIDESHHDMQPTTLLTFLAEPRNPDELLLAGFVNRYSELLTILYPYLRDGLVKLEDHRFVAVTK